MPQYLHSIFSLLFCYVGHVSCSENTECVQTRLRNGLVCELEGIFLCMQWLTPECSAFCGISHSPIILWASQPCPSVWNLTLSLNSLQFFCLKRCLWSVLRCRTPSAICQLGFLSLSFSVLCVSGRLNSPFLSKQSCDPEPFRSPVRQASPLRARGTQTRTLSFLPYRSLGKVWCVVHLHAHTHFHSLPLCVVFSCISTNI